MKPLLDAFRKYIVFIGRAGRAEFYSVLFLIVCFPMLAILAALLGFGGVAGVCASAGKLILLVTFIPFWAVSFRRLHDIGLSGWWSLVNLLPIINLLCYAFLYSRRGKALISPGVFD